MERKEANNGLQLIKIAGIKLKGNFSALFMGTLAMTTPLILILYMTALMSLLFAISWIIPIGIILFAILIGPLQVGYIKYFNAVLDGKQPRLRMVYSQLRFNIFTLRTIYISTLLLLMYIVGGVLWIVPAGFAVSAYSMTLFFLEKFEYPRLSLAMNECSRKMIGNRLAMFSYKLIFYFVYFLLFMVGLLFVALVYTLSTENLIISWIVAVCSAIVFIFLYTFVTVYYHSSNQIFFEDVLSKDEKKRQAKVHSVNINSASILEKSSDNSNKTDLSNKEKNNLASSENKKSTNQEKMVDKNSKSKKKSQETERSK
ncbi:MAG: hypothetical protein ACI4PF_04990 [Christensenellales bacterium]